MKLLIELPDKKVTALRICAKCGMELDSVNMAVVNGVPYEERKTGRWITDGCLDKCSCCGVSRDDQLYDNYCGNCGAKMEGAE